jgi:hypothetical protein
LNTALENVATIHGVEFINDSKATNVNSAWYALESMTTPVVWIVGGTDKGNDYSMSERAGETKGTYHCLPGKRQPENHQRIFNYCAIYHGSNYCKRGSDEGIIKQASRVIRYCFRLPVQVLICLKITKTGATSLKKL